MTRQRKLEMVGQLAGIRGRVEQLGKRTSRICCDDLDDYELQLLIALVRKGKGCPLLAAIAVLDLNESRLISAVHAGFGIDLGPFDLDRLSESERERMSALGNRVTARTET